MTWRASTGLAAIVAVLLLPSGAGAATFRVDSRADANDANPGNGTCRTATGKCSLRAAVDEANADIGADRIVLRAKRYQTTGIREDANDSGDYDLAISSKLRVKGAGMNRTVLDGALIDRLFQVPPGAELTLEDLKLTRGAAEFAGGGVSNVGTLVVRRVAMVGNDGGDAGGGISNTGTATVDRSLIARNDGGQTAGGISTVNPSVGFPGALTVTRSTIAGNDGGGAGGGIFADLDGSSGQVRLVNSTIHSNEAGQGGAIYTEGDDALVMNHVTVVRNSSDEGFPGALRTDGAVTLRNSLVGLSVGGLDCGGAVAITSLGGNLDGDGSCGSLASDLIAANPKVGALRRNGGPTPTVALKRRSKARNKIARSGAGCVAKDQRGVKRPQGRRCDIGAFELERRRRR